LVFQKESLWVEGFSGGLVMGSLWAVSLSGEPPRRRHPAPNATEPASANAQMKTTGKLAVGVKNAKGSIGLSPLLG
jgi:hypothetical protein